MKLFVRNYREENGYLFQFKLPSEGNLVDSLEKQIEYMKKISVYPEFTFEFNGKDIIVLTNIPTSEKKFKKSLNKFYGINGFYKSLTLFLKKTAGIANSSYMESKTVFINEFIVSWRKNPVTGLFPVEVFPDDTVEMILIKSNIGSKEIRIYSLDLINWSFLTPIKPKRKNREIDLINLPDCIKELMKSGKDTKLLKRYLLSVYSVKDTKIVLRMIGVKPDIDDVYVNLDNLGCPNCTDLKKYCKNCNKPHPLC